MSDDRFEERTEPATPRRRREARERGLVARSADLSTAAVLLAGVLALHVFGRSLVDGVFGATSSMLQGLGKADGSRENLLFFFGRSCRVALSAILPLVLGIALAAIAVNLAQVGILFSSDSLAPKVERLDPVRGLRRIFSSRSGARLLINLLKLGAIVAVVLLALWAERSRLLTLGGRPVDEIVRYGAGVMLALALRSVLVLAALAILEYGYERWQYERDLRMSRLEVREEMRRFEGDPKIRERRRELQRRLATDRMVQGVGGATAVIASSDSLAVAIEYRQEEWGAPRVVAKGAGFLDRRIRELALEHEVPVVEREDLARILYRKVDVGESIPGELYPAVAQVLAFACRARDLHPQSSNF